MLRYVLPFLMMGANAFAAPQCFQAIDTRGMSASIYNEAADSNSNEQIVQASLTLQISPWDNVTKLADLKVVTDAGKVAVAGGGNFQGVASNVYAVECDGGRMKVDFLADGKVQVTSDGIRADIEGCDGSLNISSSGTKFAPVQCEAPSTN